MAEFEAGTSLMGRRSAADHSFVALGQSLEGCKRGPFQHSRFVMSFFWGGCGKQTPVRADGEPQRKVTL